MTSASVGTARPLGELSVSRRCRLGTSGLLVWVTGHEPDEASQSSRPRPLVWITMVSMTSSIRCRSPVTDVLALSPLRAALE